MDKSESMHHGKAFGGRRALWAYLLYQCVPLERQFIVIVEVRELLLRNLHSARAGNVVHTAFLEQVI